MLGTGHGMNKDPVLGSGEHGVSMEGQGAAQWAREREGGAVRRESKCWPTSA